MKKIVSILMCLLCVASASAVTYGNPYRGAGRNGYVATGYRSASTGLSSVGTGLSKAPTATMRSTSSAGYSTAYAGTTRVASGVTTTQVRGMYTAASAVRGGVTTYSRKSASCRPRKTVGYDPGVPDLPECGCYWYFDEESGKWKCTNCGCEYTVEEMYELEEDSPCSCDDHCDCPIGDGWDVWIMLAVLAVGYAAWARRRKCRDIIPT